MVTHLFFLNDSNFNSFKSILCSCGHISEVKQFNAWLGTLPHKHKIVIAGNHELSFDETFTTKGDMDVTKDIGHRTSHTGDSIGRSSRYTIRLHCISLYFLYLFIVTDYIQYYILSPLVKLKFRVKYSRYQLLEWIEKC